MHSTRVRAFRPIARMGAIASSLAIIAMLALPNAASAATTIGSTAGTTSCNGGLDLVQTSTSLTSPSYVVPTAGDITSWSTLAGLSLNQIGLQVWRLSLAPATYQLVGASPLVTSPLPNVLSTFPLATPIPVLAGDLLGMRVEGPATCLQPGLPGDNLGYFVGLNPAVLAVEVMNAYTVDALLNISATIGTVTPPPPPPPSGGCDSTGDTSASQTCDNSGDGSGDKHVHVTGDYSNDQPSDTTINVTSDARVDQPGVSTADRSTDATRVKTAGGSRD